MQTLTLGMLVCVCVGFEGLGFRVQGLGCRPKPMVDRFHFEVSCFPNTFVGFEGPTRGTSCERHL